MLHAINAAIYPLLAHSDFVTRSSGVVTVTHVLVLQARDVAVLLPKVAGLAAAELASPHPLLDPAMLIAILVYSLGGRADAATQRS
jgi:hypothetical protein